ncbi:hypothetical protein A8C56_21835 [Niabella ginsenosidivorans]|uniref:Tail specific protease domain-containing protein n=1 Tax=Niabella ginsenosidivorans TaxID=1176587 RepID=A0A1A9I6G6_9BACT|nr:S41 family peptidase [Niabella ginsenosidivorans]ANH83268.1 hypothetical protein A8C56_21835 [Niabella ginsenosidivorans]
MKHIIATLIGALSIATAFSQIENPGFETVSDGHPQNWNIKKVDGYTIKVTSAEKHNGNHSLYISNTTNNDVKTFQSFSQKIAVSIDTIDKISLNVFVKLKDVKNNVALWCQLWDSAGKQIGFYNSNQNAVLNGTNDWQALKLKMTVSSQVKTLFFGAYLMGSGAVWFDDFTTEKNTLSNTPPSAEAALYSKKFTEIVEQNSLFTDSLNWSGIKPSMQKLLAGAVTIEDTRDATNYLLSELRAAGDNHSFFTNKKVANDYKKGNFVADVPKSALIDDRIGYIYVPTFGTVNNKVGQNFSDTIRTLIKTIDNHHKIEGWIIDLRKNGGGNMWPMLSGLKTFVGKGTPGYFIKGKYKTAWRIGGPSMRLKNKIHKIAVLLGPSTASSGEMTAVAFIGKPNVKTFGQPSAGYTTANSIFYLPDGAMIALATTTVADRTEKVYYGKLIPDILVEPNAGKDADIEAASNWILAK